MYATKKTQQISIPVLILLVVRHVITKNYFAVGSAASLYPLFVRRLVCYEMYVKFTAALLVMQV
jgi:hypothetical protein